MRHGPLPVKEAGPLCWHDHQIGNIFPDFNTKHSRVQAKSPSTRQPPLQESGVVFSRNSHGGFYLNHLTADSTVSCCCHLGSSVSSSFCCEGKRGFAQPCRIKFLLECLNLEKETKTQPFSRKRHSHPQACKLSKAKPKYWPTWCFSHYCWSRMMS